MILSRPILFLSRPILFLSRLILSIENHDDPGVTFLAVEVTAVTMGSDSAIKNKYLVMVGLGFSSLIIYLRSIGCAHVPFLSFINTFVW